MWLLMFRCYLSFRAWPILRTHTRLTNVCTLTRLWLLKLNPVCPVTHCSKEFMSNLEPEDACGPAGVNQYPFCHYTAKLSVRVSRLRQRLKAANAWHWQFCPYNWRDTESLIHIAHWNITKSMPLDAGNYSYCKWWFSGIRDH